MSQSSSESLSHSTDDRNALDLMLDPFGFSAMGDTVANRQVYQLDDNRECSHAFLTPDAGMAQELTGSIANFFTGQGPAFAPDVDVVAQELTSGVTNFFSGQGPAFGLNVNVAAQELTGGVANFFSGKGPAFRPDVDVVSSPTVLRSFGVIPTPSSFSPISEHSPSDLLFRPLKDGRGL